MASFERAGVSLYYEEYGAGHPLLLFAPGGMRSLRWATFPVSSALRHSCWPRQRPSRGDGSSRMMRLKDSRPRATWMVWRGGSGFAGLIWFEFGSAHLADAEVIMDRV